jgi:hypothetical protein
VDGFSLDSQVIRGSQRQARVKDEERERNKSREGRESRREVMRGYRRIGRLGSRGFEESRSVSRKRPA